jgi:hypothetical protein
MIQGDCHEKDSPNSRPGLSVDQWHGTDQRIWFCLLPLSTDPCFIAKEGTPHFVAIPPSDGLARLPVLVRKS